MSDFQNDIYEETLGIVLGMVKKSPVLEDLANWFMSTYSAKIINFRFALADTRQSNRYRLYMILETREDYLKMVNHLLHDNKAHTTHVANGFKGIAQRHQYATDEQIKEMWVAYQDFSEEAGRKTSRKAILEAKPQILEKNPTVWDVISSASYGLVVFYYTGNDVIENQNNGTSKMIEDAYYSILKKYDQIKFFTKGNMHLMFDSKENLDKNYGGSLFFYFR